MSSQKRTLPIVLKCVVLGLLFALPSSGHMHGLWIFAHGSLFVVGSCSLSVGHTVNFGFKPSGAFTKLSTAPSTSNPVTSGAAA